MKTDFAILCAEINEPVDMPAMSQIWMGGDGVMIRWFWETYYTEPMCFTFIMGKWKKA